MHSPPRTALSLGWLWVIGFTVALLWASGRVLAQDVTAASALNDNQIQAAVQQVRDDPAWGRQTQEQQLRFKPTTDKADPQPRPQGEAATWVAQLLQSIAQMSRVLVWILIAAAAAVCLVGLRRWVQVHGDATVPLPAQFPSHVSHLDIRPQSLPDNVGEAAVALWQRGETRLALSLLYRGVLSNLVHQHQVPIVAASTEDECVALASVRLDPGRTDYVRRMVSAWQRAVYGTEMPADAWMLALCHEFETHFATVRAGRRIA